MCSTTRKTFYILSLMIFVLSLVYSHSASANTGWCTPTSGTPYDFHISFVNEVTDITNNQAGTVIDPAGSWDNGQRFSITCDCDGSKAPRLFKGSSPLPLYGTYNSKSYYDANENLAIAVDIYVGGNGMHNVPFTDQSNNSPDKLCNTPITNADSGSKGSIALVIKKPFVGVSTIPETLVAEMYSGRNKGNYPTTPISRIFISGTVTVPQSCKINDGQIINIDFGRILNSSLKNKGQGPDGYTAIVTQLAYVCTNVSEGVKINFIFNGQSATGDDSSLATSNSDIGIRIEDANGATIAPNSAKLPGQFSASTQTGTTTFKSYPVNISGNMPAAGSFTSTATINMMLE